MSELISIVVPVHNVEKYLPDCLDSIVNQSYSNIEVLLVDDGSSDGSGVICDEYAHRDSRVRVFHRENSGAGKSRKVGVENSTGEHIVFVDADDWMSLDCVETLYRELIPEVDIVIGVGKFYNDSNGEYRDRRLFYSVDYRTYDRIEHLRAIILKELPCEPWAKIYRKRLFADIYFPNTKRSQDFLMNVEVACQCRAVKVIKRHIYFYRDDSSSSTKTTFVRDKEFCVSIYSIVYETLKRNNLYDSEKETFAALVYRLFYADGKHTFFFDNTPLIEEVIKNIDRTKLSFKKRVYLRAFNSPILQSILLIIRGTYRVSIGRK